MSVNVADALSVEAFLAELAYQRRASEHTLDAYRHDLQQLQQLTRGAELQSLAQPQLRRAAMQLHGQGRGARTIARCLSAWRAYYRWLARRGAIAADPCKGVRAPKAARPLPKALTVDQAQALLDAPQEGPLAARDRAMFELFYSSGLRLSELAGLELSDAAQLAQGEVTVTGKRDKTRIVPVGARACAALAAWIEERSALAAADEPALFVNRRGGRLTPRSIERRLDAWARRAGMGVHVHPHMLRHSFASHVLQSSGDLRAVQEMLGHASISTTQVYTHLDFQHLAKVYDAAHPRARKK